MLHCSTIAPQAGKASKPCKTMAQLNFQELDDGVFCIDTHLFRPNHTASYLLRRDDELAFFDMGAANNVPGLLDVVARIGLGPQHVRYVMPTHVHLDHAGGAGALMAACPEATLVTHYNGVQHLTDPSRLQKGAMAVYGEQEFLRLYGELTPIHEDRVIAAHEGDAYELGGKTIRFIDTPGHANHHGCFFDSGSGNLFTGDTFGLSYREFDSEEGPWVLATTTPVAFDPDLWLDSLERMIALRPTAVCPTHFGQLPQPETLVAMIRDSIKEHTAIALQDEKLDDDGRAARLNAAIDRVLVSEATRRRPDISATKARELLQLDIDLNAQGLHVWLQRRAKQRASH